MVTAVFRFSSIGDILMTTPAVRGLAEQGSGRVVYVTKEAFAPLLSGNPNVEAVVGYRAGESLWSLRRRVAAHRPGLIVDLHDNPRSRGISLLFPFTRTLRTRKGSADRQSLVGQGPGPYPTLPHMADRHWQALAPLGIRDDGRGLEYHTLPGDAEGVTEALPGLTTWELEEGGYTVVAIGARHATKRLPVELLTDLVRGLPGRVILIGGPEDEETGAIIAGSLALEGNWGIINGCGRLTLRQSGWVLSRAGRVWAHDSGMMHLAAALGRPLEVIWGSTVPAFGMLPYRAAHTAHEVEGLACRPCHKHGQPACPLGHFACMRQHTTLPLVGRGY